MDLKRIVHPATKAALGGIIRPIVMVFLDWPGAAIRTHSGVGDLVWGGHTWRGVGNFGAVSIPDEALGGVPSEAALSLIAPLAELAEYLDDPIRNRPGAIYAALTVTPGGNVLIGDPWQVYSGTMDAMVFQADADDGGITYSATVTLTGGPGYRTSATIAHSHEDQSRRYPGDTGMRFLTTAGLKFRDITWPA